MYTVAGEYKCSVGNAPPAIPEQPVSHSNSPKDAMAKALFILSSPNYAKDIVTAPPEGIRGAHWCAERAVNTGQVRDALSTVLLRALTSPLTLAPLSQLLQVLLASCADDVRGRLAFVLPDASPWLVEKAESLLLAMHGPFYMQALKASCARVFLPCTQT